MRIALFIIRIANFIKSFSVMVMRPGDIAELSRELYSRNETIFHYGDSDFLDEGLDSVEKKLLKQIPYNSGRMLILGVGGGREAIPLARMGFQITGIDYIPEMLEKTKQNAKKSGVDIQCLLQEFTSLDVGENVFEVVWMSESMYSSVPTREWRIDMLKTINKALQPEGFFICQFCYDFEIKISRFAELLRKIFAWITLGNTQYEPAGTLSKEGDFSHIFLSEKELRDEFNSGGFEVTYIDVSGITLRGNAVLKKI